MRACYLSGFPLRSSPHSSQEELDRYEGFWLSPSGKQVAFEEVDERHVPPYTIVRQGGTSAERGVSEQHRYPFVGEANPLVKVGVVATDDNKGKGKSSSGDDVTWFDLDAACQACFGGSAPVPVLASDGVTAVGHDWYLGRLEWLPTGDALIAQVSTQGFMATLELCDFFRPYSCTLFL